MDLEIALSKVSQQRKIPQDITSIWNITTQMSTFTKTYMTSDTENRLWLPRGSESRARRDWKFGGVG